MSKKKKKKNNKVRVWKLGSLEHNIPPHIKAVKALKKMLKEGVTDIIWGPDIEIIEVER